MEYVLQLEELQKTYRSGAKAVSALQDVSLSVPAGQVVGLVGPNGAGKTTLMKAVTGLTRPDRGKVLLFGRPRDASINGRLGYLPEDPQFFKNITARELVSFSHRLCGGGRKDQRVEDVLSMVGLLDAADRPVLSFSKGMKQRVGLAQALVHEPDLLILDEPMSGLDPGGRSRIKSILKEYCAPDRSILFSSHDLGDVEDLCSRVVWVEKGQVRLDASIVEMQKQSAFEVHWQKRNRVSDRRVRDEAELWSLLDEIRVSGGHLLRIQRCLSQRIDELLEIGRKG